ncbi:MAG: orotate phosphoribosyltransferase [Cytophagales bacterium]|nr:orotate phosphoribosyltransferase [Cytophagales bacterium]
MNISHTIAQKLLEIEAVKLSPAEPYKWSSGWLSPIYCDNRLTLSYPPVRHLIKTAFVDVVHTHFKDAEAIAGVATAGIPQGALVADAMNIPLIYVRPKPKDHGMENLIEGKLIQGQKVVVLEDLVSTGGSSLKAVEALREAGAVVLGMVCIFTYGFDVATRQFADAKVKLCPLCNYDTLMEICVSSQKFTENELAALKDWRHAPDSWGR